MKRGIAVSVGCLTLVCALALIGSGKAVSQANQGTQNTGGPSLQETLNYINSKFEDTPHFRNASFSVSDDHRTLISRYEFRWNDRGKDVWIAYEKRIAVKEIAKIEGVGNDDRYHSISIECPGLTSCARVKDDYFNLGWQAVWRVGTGSFPVDEEQTARLVRAFQHLVDLLKAEQPKGDPDPFAK